MPTWRELITPAMEQYGDSWDKVASCTLDDAELDREFDNGYGGSKGTPFLLWTTRFVYFPVVYDGSEWVGCVPRRPNVAGYECHHMGG